MAVAATLRRLIEESGLSASAVAMRAGLPQSTLSRIVNGLRAIDMEQLDRLCRALDAEPHAVLSEAWSATRLE